MKIVLDTNCFINAMSTNPTLRDPIVEILNEYKRGTIGLYVSRQVGSWEQMEGTWCDAKANDSIQEELMELAGKGNSIRDRGAFLDALKAKADFFVTSDLQLVADKYAKKISGRFVLRILSPTELVKILRQKA